MAKERYDCAKCKRRGFYMNRVCKRYFPDREVPSPDVWTPRYETTGKEAVPYHVEGIRSVECPVSAITGTSEEYVNQFIRARRLKEATGAAPLGSDPPARLVDAFDELEAQSRLVEAARMEAESTR